MNIFRSIQNGTDKFKFPEEGEGLGGDSENESEEEIEIIEEIPDKDDKEDESDDKEDDVDDSDDKEEDEDETVTDEEKKDSVIKRVTAKHKTLFKEFPELKAAFFKARQYEELFTTPAEAKEAAEAASNLKAVANQFTAGKVDAVFDLFKENDKGLVTFGRNLIEETQKNPKVWQAIVAPTILGVLHETLNVAKLHKNDNLEKSIAWLSKHIFNSDQLPALEKNEPAAENKELVEFQNKVQREFSADVEENAFSSRDKAIETSLAALKVKPAVKKTIANEIKEEINSILDTDKVHMSKMQNLWRKAKESNYSRASRAAIIDAYAAGVKRVLPETRVKILKQNGFNIKMGKKTSANGNDDSKVLNFRENGDSKDKNTSSKSVDVKITEAKKRGASERELMDIAMGVK